MSDTQHAADVFSILEKYYQKPVTEELIKEFTRDCYQKIELAIDWSEDALNYIQTGTDEPTFTKQQAGMFNEIVDGFWDYCQAKGIDINELTWDEQATEWERRGIPHPGTHAEIEAREQSDLEEVQESSNSVMNTINEWDVWREQHPVEKMTAEELYNRFSRAINSEDYVHMDSDDALQHYAELIHNDIINTPGTDPDDERWFEVALDKSRDMINYALEPVSLSEDTEFRSMLEEDMGDAEEWNNMPLEHKEALLLSIDNNSEQNLVALANYDWNDLPSNIIDALSGSKMGLNEDDINVEEDKQARGHFLDNVAKMEYIMHYIADCFQLQEDFDIELEKYITKGYPFADPIFSVKDDVAEWLKYLESQLGETVQEPMFSKNMTAKNTDEFKGYFISLLHDLIKTMKLLNNMINDYNLAGVITEGYPFQSDFKDMYIGVGNWVKSTEMSLSRDNIISDAYSLGESFGVNEGDVKGILKEMGIDFDEDEDDENAMPSKESLRGLWEELRQGYGEVDSFFPDWVGEFLIDEGYVNKNDRTGRIPGYSFSNYSMGLFNHFELFYETILEEYNAYDRTGNAFDSDDDE